MRRADRISIQFGTAYSDVRTIYPANSDVKKLGYPAISLVYIFTSYTQDLSPHSTDAFTAACTGRPKTLLNIISKNPSEQLHSFGHFTLSSSGHTQKGLFSSAMITPLSLSNVTFHPQVSTINEINSGLPQMVQVPCPFHLQYSGERRLLYLFVLILDAEI